MRLVLAFVAWVGLLVLVLGCQVPMGGNLRQPATRMLDRPVALKKDGPVVHKPSGFTFPDRYAGFRRVGGHRYDTAGLEIDVEYRDVWPGCAVDAQFTIYPSDRPRSPAVSSGGPSQPSASPLERELAHARRKLSRERPYLEAFAEGSTIVPATGVDLEGPFVRFRERGEISELQLFLFRGEWFLRYVFSYPERCADDANAKLAAVTKKLPWAAPMGRAPGTVCEDLAYTFFVIAESRDRGRTKRDQEHAIRESVRSPFVENPEEARQQLLRVVDVVYRSPAATPEEIEAGVLERCEIDDRGQAVVRGPSPGP